jgi:hypothetical protein
MSIKVVARRKRIEDPILDIEILQRTINDLRGKALVRRGVYRFESFEEAEQWMIREIVATHARRSSTISSESASL